MKDVFKRNNKQHNGECKFCTFSLTKGLMSHTVAVDVNYNPLYITLSSPAKQQREMTKFWVLCKTVTTTTVHSYNTRSSTKLNFYRPQVRTNIGKFTFKYSASVMWETVPLALKKANTFNKFKKLYKAHLISCQSANICSF